MTAGNAKGTRHQLALKLGEEAARRNLTLAVIPSVGSEDALDRVNRRDLDVALVQGGLAVDDRLDVRQVATLHVEPLQLLVKKELFDGASASLTALRGKTVDLEEVGSGSHSLAVAVLSFVGLQPRGRDPARGYLPVSLDRDKLFAEQDTARLPDAVFLVSSLPAPIAKYLVTRHGYRLVPLPFAEAFALESLAKTAGDEQPRAAHGRVEMGRIHATTIPPFVCSAEPPVPAAPVPTLGTRLLLVAHKDVPARAAYQLVEATYAAAFGRVVHPPLDAKLMELPPEFPWHSGAQLFLERNRPVVSGAVMDATHKGMAILAAAVSGLFVLWQWSKQHGQFLRDKGFNDYIRGVARIEEQAAGTDTSRPTALPQLVALRHELGCLKSEVLDRFTRGELAGKELLSGFLIQVNDTRDFISGLIRQSPANATVAVGMPDTCPTDLSAEGLRS
jgi:TRAP-type uncharacterized transport system substrate-binding protein